MALYLVQHGKSLPADIDPEQGLSTEGVAETECMAQMAKDAALKVKGILHSGKPRARRTADILAAALKPAEGAMRKSPLKGLSIRFVEWWSNQISQRGSKGRLATTSPGRISARPLVNSLGSTQWTGCRISRASDIKTAQTTPSKSGRVTIRIMLFYTPWWSLTIAQFQLKSTPAFIMLPGIERNDKEVNHGALPRATRQEPARGH